MNFSFTPPPDLLPSAWAEQNIYIPAGNARPGLISFEDQAYQRGIIDAAADPDIQRITLKMGAQTGKTMAALCLMGYHTLREPFSQILMLPTGDDLEAWIQTKFNPMVDVNADLKACYAPPRGREGANNKTLKEFKGGVLMFATAGSASSQRSRSAPVIICDEVDAYKFSAEGHPVDVVWERSSTFGDKGLLIEMSTPTVVGKSRIEKSYKQGDCRRYYVVCPDCRHRHVLEWSEQTVRWEPGKPRTAKLYCPNCERPFDDYQRMALVRNAERDGGGWQAEVENYAGHASFHLNALYSPLRRLSRIVAAYEAAEDTQDHKTFTQTILAEAYEEVGEKGSAEEIANRSEVYDSEVPEGVQVLTAGLDVQADRIEYEVVGWGRDEESWSLDYVVALGDTSQDAIYRKVFGDLLQKAYTGKNGQKWYITAAGVDTGFNTGKVYEGIRRAGRSPIIFALKGVGGWKTEEVRRTSRAKLERGRWRPSIISVGVDKVKLTVMRRLNLQSPGPGYCHFPYDRDLEYFLQLTSEHLIRTTKYGFPQDRWEKRYERNEAFDCRVYAYATLKLVAPQPEHLTEPMTGAPQQTRRKRIKASLIR